MLGQWVLLETHPLSSATKKVVTKFKPKFEGPYRILKVQNNNLISWKAGKRLVVNIDQVRIYPQRKSDENVTKLEIWIALDQFQASRFEGVRPRSDRSQNSRNSESGK
ncbi:hypothetical protein TNCV_55371 [Trichonephila clavipes]|nr:hypothetical protein TNCV_55371 [Trichonephila clavipes]